MKQFEAQYQDLLLDIVANGTAITSRKGDSHQVLGKTLTLDGMEVPLITGRRMYPNGIIGELKGFLNDAQTDEEYRAYGCNFWGAWTGQGIDYASLLHDFNGINQLQRTIDTLRNHPGSRKHVISLWDPSSDTLQPPCVMHYQWLVEHDKLHMIWSQRSADALIGLASDMFSAWLFNLLMSKATGYWPGKIYMQLGSAHIYDIHDPSDYLSRLLEPAEIRYKLEFKDIYNWDIEILNYNPQPPIKYQLCV
jgi:thymidylate synthase